MPSDATKASGLAGAMILLLVLGIAIGIYVGIKIQKQKEEGPGRWEMGLAKQYESATEGKWGEVIHEYEGWSCEAHRWQYRRMYYIGHVGNQCGALIRESTRK